MVPLLVLLIAGSFCVDTVTAEGCRFGEIFKNGSCQRCRCYAGEEFNRTTIATLNQSEENGFPECPPCSPCLEGRYREPGYMNNRCRKCRLDCGRVNKYWETFCGGSSPGKCGNCYSGFEQVSIDSNSRCVNKSHMQPAPPQARVPVKCSDGFYLANEVCHHCLNCSQLNKHVIKPCGGRDKGSCGGCKTGFVLGDHGQCVEEFGHIRPRELAKDKPVDVPGLSSDGMIVLFVTVAAVLIAFALLLIFFVRRCRSSASSATAQSVSSKTCILAQSNLSTDTDLQTDGPPSYVRAELIDVSSPSELRALLLPPLTIYPEVRFTEEHCHALGKFISGDEKVLAFFRHLGVSDVIYDPHRDKFFNDRLIFADYVTKSMVGWTQSLTIDATLDKVCAAMDATSFGDKVPLLLAEHERLYPPRSEERIPMEHGEH